MEEREQRQWWAVLEQRVSPVTGYGCPPEYPGYWWCPEVGSTLFVGSHLFNTEREALTALAGQLDREVSRLMGQLTEVQRRLGV